jgi:hypothetical protein
MVALLGAKVEGIFITWREVLIGLILVAVFYLLQAVFLFIRRRNAASVAIPGNIDQELAQLRKDLAVMRMRLDALENKVWASVQAVAPMPASKDPEEVAFSQSPHGQAMLLARDGLDANELARRCGISVSEASLIVAMQRQHKASR